VEHKIYFKEHWAPNNTESHHKNRSTPTYPSVLLKICAKRACSAVCWSWML